MRKVDLIKRALPVAHLNCSDPAKPFEPRQGKVKPTLAQTRDPHESGAADPAVIAVEPVGIAEKPEVGHLRCERQRGKDEIHHHAKRFAQQRFWQVLSKLSGR